MRRWKQPTLLVAILERARNSARNHAAELGATHIVLGEMTPANRSYTISGRAYKCGATPQ
jgi:hypothetical protein